jgi:sugar diacid utilization regulator
VLDGRTAPEVLASSLGVAPTSFVTVVAFELHLEPDAALADQTVMVDRAVSSIAVHCEAYRRQVASVAEGQVIYVLLPDRVPPDPVRLTNFAAAIVDHLADGLAVAAKAAIGPTVDGLGGVLVSRAEADQALRALVTEQAPVVAHIDEVRSRAILLALHDHAVRDPGLRAGKLQRLVEHDKDRGSVFVATLRAYLDAFGDVARAAAVLEVHPNTFRYRLRRLLELSEIDLTDADERLVTHLQLTFLDDDDAR